MTLGPRRLQWMVTWGLLSLWAIWGPSVAVPSTVLTLSIHAPTQGRALCSPREPPGLPPTSRLVLCNRTFRTTVFTHKCPVPRNAPPAPVWGRHGGQRQSPHRGLASTLFLASSSAGRGWKCWSGAELWGPQVHVWGSQTHPAEHQWSGLQRRGRLQCGHGSCRKSRSLHVSPSSSRE